MSVDSTPLWRCWLQKSGENSLGIYSGGGAEAVIMITMAPIQRGTSPL
jgi:hypothetical protein